MNHCLQVMLLVIIASTAPAIAKADTLVDTQIIKEIDVSGDGHMAKVALELKAPNWDSPVIWRIIITDNNGVIFEYKSDDTWLNAFFSDKGYVDNCSGYMQCKKKYYEHDLLEGLFVPTDLGANEHAFDPSNPGSIHVVALDSLVRSFRVPEERARGIVQSIIDRIRTGKAPLLYVPRSPVQSLFPLIYVPEVKGFVRVYEW